MYRFEKLIVYQNAKAINLVVLKWLKSQNGLEFYIKNQLGRAALSIVLNIAEGSGRKTDSDQRRFYIMSRSSLFEVVAILDILKEADTPHLSELLKVSRKLEELSRQLHSLITSLEP